MAPVELGVDEQGDEERNPAEQREDALADEVVVRVAGDVVARDPGDGPQTDADEGADRAQQEPVEVARRPRESVPLLTDANPDPGDVLDHQSVAPGSANCADLTWKNCWNTCSAAGAAAVPPWPPFSISAQTTSSGSSTGP